MGLTHTMSSVHTLLIYHLDIGSLVMGLLLGGRAHGFHTECPWFYPCYIQVALKKISDFHYQSVLIHSLQTGDRCAPVKASLVQMEIFVPWGTLLTMHLLVPKLCSSQTLLWDENEVGKH